AVAVALSIWIIRNHDARFGQHRAWDHLSERSLLEERLEKRERVFGARLLCAMQCQQHFLFVAAGDEVLHFVDADAAVEASELPRDRIRERQIRAWLEPAHTLAAGQNCGAREAEKNRLREVRMAEHELALRQRCEF